MSEIALAERLAAVQSRIEAAAARAGRDPKEITLVAVSKRKDAALVAAAVAAGVRNLGENYLQESQSKIPEVHGLIDPSALPHWHFIGKLQRNKARHVARLFDVVETLDRSALGVELDRRAAQAERRLSVLLQVNVCDEPQKGGVAPAELEALIEASRAWSQLEVRGLMTIPRSSPDPADARAAFARLRALRDQHREQPGGERLVELSMGMSADYEVAIEEGATLVRVGTAIFGPRS